MYSETRFTSEREPPPERSGKAPVRVSYRIRKFAESLQWFARLYVIDRKQ